MTPPRLVLTCLAALALLTGATSASAAPPGTRAWLTTGDRANLLAEQTDFGLRHFSIAHDRAEILPLLRQARALSPNLKIMATPWSPPAWMKTSDSLIGGGFRGNPPRSDPQARYFRRLIP